MARRKSELLCGMLLAQRDSQGQHNVAVKHTSSVGETYRLKRKVVLRWPGNKKERGHGGSRKVPSSQSTADYLLPGLITADCLTFLTIRNNSDRSTYWRPNLTYCITVCCCFLPIHFGHQVRWTYQPGSHRRKVIQDFSSTFFLRCVPLFFSREGFSHSFPSSTVKSNFVY